jgi:hypothetical protein
MREVLFRRLSALVLAGGVVVCAAGGGALPAWRAEARQGARARRSEARKWEYSFVARSYVIRSGDGSAGVVELCYIRDAGCRVVKVSAANRSDATLKAISRLGAEGWEAIGLLPSPLEERAEVMFFKRPAR